MRQPKAFSFVGDWHGNTRWAVSAIEAVAYNGADTILHLGDYGYTFADEFVNAVEAECAEQNVMLYFIDGNHDLHELLWALPEDEDGFGVLSPHVRYIPRGHRWQWWGLTFMGLGGATSVDKPDRKPYTEWWPTESVRRRDVRKAIYGDGAELIGGPLGGPVPVDVMIAHDCPTGVPIPGISMREGLQFFTHEMLQQAENHRRVMREVFEQVKPKLYVHGHYHRFYTHTGDFGCKFVGLDMDTTQNNLWIVRSAEELVAQ